VNQVHHDEKKRERPQKDYPVQREQSSYHSNIEQYHRKAQSSERADLMPSTVMQTAVPYDYMC
jgi:hypothetical protein